MRNKGRRFVGMLGQEYGGEASPPSGEFTSVSAGVAYTCGVRVDGSLECWGDVEWEPTGEFVSVGAGFGHTCGVKADSSVVCRSYADWIDPSTSASGEFVSVSAGSGYGCGLRTDGSVACWGSELSWPVDYEFLVEMEESPFRNDLKGCEESYYADLGNGAHPWAAISSTSSWIELGRGGAACRSG